MGKQFPVDSKELGLVKSVFDKAVSLVDYYGMTNASAEFYYEALALKDWGYTLSQARSALELLKRNGALPSVGLHDNVFEAQDPSLGFSGWGKPHAPVIEYYRYDRSLFNLIMLSFKHLAQSSLGVKP